MATDGVKVSNTEITQTFDVWRRNTNDAADRLNSITTSFENNRITLTGNVEVGTSKQNFVVDSGTNRVGIGTSTPAVKLDVVGETNISADLKVDTDTLYVNSTTDRVGINNATPTEALDVTGKVLVSDDLMVSGTVSNVLIVNTSLTAVGINVDVPTAGSLEVSGNVVLQNSDSLRIKNNGGTSQTVLTVNASDSTILQGSGGTESVAIKSSNGTSMITMTEAGVTAFSANVSIPDNEILSIGNSEDLIVYHDASDSYVKEQGTGNFYVQSTSGSVNIQTNTNANSVVAEQGGAVTLYFSDAPNNAKLATKTDGVDITGELQSDSLDVDGAADILGATTLQSTLQVDGIATFNNNVSLQDNDSLLIGTDDDLHLYHDASDSYIKEQGTGDLYIQSTAGAIRLQTNTSENSIVASQDGAVDLYHNDVLRLSTTASGVNVPQTLTAAGLDINGTADISQGVTLNSSSGTTTIQGATTINDTLDVAGITTLSNDLLVSTSSNASNTLFVDVSTQRVGINNDSPTQALDIDGNIDLTGIIKATGENPGYFLTLDTGGSSMAYVDITDVLASNGTVSKPLNAPYPNAIGTERDVATWSSNTVITGNTNMLTYDTAAGQLNVKRGNIATSATLSIQDGTTNHAEFEKDDSLLSIRSGSGSGSILFSGETDSTNIGSFQVRFGGVNEDIYHSGNLPDDVTVDNEDTSASTHYLTFINTTSGTQSRLYEDSGLTYVPSTGTLTAVTFTGDLVGNADTATDLSRDVIAGAGLTGGGTLTGGNVTLNVVGGVGGGISVTADAVAVDSTVVRTTRTVTAGSGLTDGGALSSDITLNVGAGDGISVAADAVAVDTTVLRTTGTQTITGNKTFSTGSLLKFNDDIELQMGSGTGGDFSIDFNSSVNDLIINQNTNTEHDIVIIDATSATKFTFDISAGDLSATTFTGNLVGNADTATDLSRSVNGGSGLTGGGLLNTDRTLAVGQGDGISVTADAVAVDTTVVRTTRDVIAGTGLTGGGVLSSDITLNVVGGDGIDANADDIAVDTTVVRTSGAQTIAGDKTFSNTIDFNGAVSLDGATTSSSSFVVDGGQLRVNDSVEFYLGSNLDTAFFHDGVHLYLDLNNDGIAGDNLYIRDKNGGTTTRFTLSGDTGDLTLATGDLVLTSGSLVGDSDIPRISSSFTVTLNIKNSAGTTQKTLKSIP